MSIRESLNAAVDDMLARVKRRGVLVQMSIYKDHPVGLLQRLAIEGAPAEIDGDALAILRKAGV